MSVSLSDDNFRKPWRTKLIFAHPVYLWKYGSSSYTKVMGSRSRSHVQKKRPLLSCHPYATVSAWIQLPIWRAQCVIQGRHVHMTMGGFWHHTCPTHSRVVGLRLEGSLFKYKFCII